MHGWPRTEHAQCLCDTIAQDYSTVRRLVLRRVGVTVHEVRESARQGGANQGRPGPDDSVERPALLTTQVSLAADQQSPVPYSLVLSETKLVRRPHHKKSQR